MNIKTWSFQTRVLVPLDSKQLLQQRGLRLEEVTVTNTGEVLQAAQVLAQKQVKVCPVVLRLLGVLSSGPAESTGESQSVRRSKE